MTDRTRRQLLAALGVAGLSGCTLLNPEASTTPAGTTPPGTPTERPTPRPTGTPVSEEAAADVHLMISTQLSDHEWVEKWEDEIVPGFERQFDLSVGTDWPVRSSRRAGRLRTLLDADDPPEVYYSDVRELAGHVAGGHLRPVDDFVAELAESNGPLVGEHLLRSDGRTYLVPHGLVLGTVLNYRSDVYAELGLSVPETWDELVANAKAIDESDQFDARGFGVVPGDEVFTTFLYTAGGDLWRWRDSAEDAVELALRPEDVRAALGMMQSLAEYSPDPAETSYADVILGWFEGTIAQCFFPNAWLAGFAYDYETDRSRSPTVALNTRQAPPPLRDRTLEPVTRASAWVDGTPLFEGTNVRHAKQFLRYMYQGRARQADKNSVDMRYLPPYPDVLNSDEYASSDIYRAEDGHFLELERHLMDEVAPYYVAERPRTTAALYAMEPNWADDAPLNELVRSVLVDGKPIDEAVERARTRLEFRLEEGRELMSG